MHALDAPGRQIANGDAGPAGGVAPTTTWAAGDVIRDPHRLRLPADVAAAAYEVGIYDPKTGRRGVSPGAQAPGSVYKADS